MPVVLDALVDEGGDADPAAQTHMAMWSAGIGDCQVVHTGEKRANGRWLVPKMTIGAVFAPRK